jgi:hypothetical protein
MTVDEALESFAEIRASLFSPPEPINETLSAGFVPITKYRASEAQSMLQSIIAGDFRTHYESTSTEDINMVRLEPFEYEKDRTRT